MRRASAEGTAGGTLAAALAQVGPWAAEQAARDNDVPARAASRVRSSNDDRRARRRSQLVSLKKKRKELVVSSAPASENLDDKRRRPRRRASSSSHGPRGARLPRRARVLGDHPRRRGPRHPLHAQGRAVRAGRARSRRAEDAPGRFTSTTRASRRRGARGRSWRTARIARARGDGDEAATARGVLRVQRGVGARAPAGRQPDGLRARRVRRRLPTRLSTRLRTWRATRYPRRGARTPKSAFLPCSRALEEARPSETCEPGDELHLGACDGGASASRASPAPRLITAPPRSSARRRRACRDGDGDGPPRARASSGHARAPSAPRASRCGTRAHNERRRRGGDERVAPRPASST